MTDEMKRMISTVEGEAPSSEFVAELRERIVAETGQPAQMPSEISVLDVEPRRPPKERSQLWRAGLAAAAAIIAVVGLFPLFSGEDQEGIDATGVPASSTEPVPATIAAPRQDPVEFASDAPPVIGEDMFLDPGAHRINTAGTPFSFVVDQLVLSPVNRWGYVVLADPRSEGADDRDLHIHRLSALWDPAQSELVAEGEDQPLEVADFAAWLDRVPEEVVVTRREETLIGGLPATRADLEISSSCATLAEDLCVPFGTTGDRARVLRAGAMYRIWVVDQGSEDPLAIVMGIGRAIDQAWFDTADELLATLAFGNIGPNPVFAAAEASVERDTWGGIRFEVPSGSLGLREFDSDDKVVLTGWLSDSAFLTNPFDLDGNELFTTDELVVALGASGVGVTEQDATAIDGIGTRVFDLIAEASQPALRRGAASNAEWVAPRQGRLWLVEHPDRGLLMITAEASTNVDIVLPLIVAQTEAIIGSLEFVDVG